MANFDGCLFLSVEGRLLNAIFRKIKYKIFSIFHRGRFRIHKQGSTDLKAWFFNCLLRFWPLKIISMIFHLPMTSYFLSANVFEIRSFILYFWSILIYILLLNIHKARIIALIYWSISHISSMIMFLSIAHPLRNLLTIVSMSNNEYVELM